MPAKEIQIHLIALPSVFLWIGFVAAISFMETWLKFRAPGVTLPVGLSIGSLIYNALNKVEWVWVLLIAVDLFLLNRSGINPPRILFLTALGMLILQTVWLLPALDARVILYQQGLKAPSSPVHIIYVISEVIKIISLLIMGIHFLHSTRMVYMHAHT